MTCSTPDKTDGLTVLTEGCKAVEEKIVASGGNFAIQMALRLSLQPTRMSLLPRSERLRRRMPRLTETMTTIRSEWVATRTWAVTARTRTVRRRKDPGMKGRALKTRSERGGARYTVMSTSLYCAV